MKELGKKLPVMILLLMGVLLLGGCGSKEQEPVQTSEPEAEETEPVAKEAEGTKETDVTSDGASELLSGKHYVEIEIQDYGIIKAELDADIAPISVTNFVKLAKEGFYDGLTFHRIISGFMIQGGDPLGNGTGGSEETIKGEFSANGMENPLSHTRGAISMARSMDYDSASSQFFIVHQDSTFLDGEYAAFGYVTEGMDIVDKICSDVVPADQNGSVPKEEQPVITAVRVAE